MGDIGVKESEGHWDKVIGDKGQGTWVVGGHVGQEDRVAER